MLQDRRLSKDQATLHTWTHHIPKQHPMLVLATRVKRKGEANMSVVIEVPSRDLKTRVSCQT